MATIDNRVCYNCIGDEFLANQVKEKYTKGTCSYCAKTRQVITLTNLAHRIHYALQEHFELTEDNPIEPDDINLQREGLWEREGDTVSCIIAKIAGLRKKIVNDLVKRLSSLYSYRAVKEGSEDPYGHEAMYIEQDPDDWDLRDLWDDFERELQSRSRYFSTLAEEAMHAVFSDLENYKSHADNSIILKISPNEEDRFVWRARVARSDEELKAILEFPEREMGPPPSRLAKAGRMNARGIPVFYGAMDKSTCIAEVRPPVGGYAVLARYELIRPVQLLDCDALAAAYTEFSYFSHEYSGRKGHAAFFKWLAREIGRPIMPQDEHVEYISTQALAEYLAIKAKIEFDGIIFNSSQTGGDGRNLVLFNHASGIKPSGNTGEGVEVDIRVHFTRSPQPTLRSDLESLEVHSVESVQYCTKLLDIDRYSPTDEDFAQWSGVVEK